MVSHSLHQCTKQWLGQVSPREETREKEVAISAGWHQTGMECSAHPTTTPVLSILLIDDEPGICLLLRQGLATQGYRLYEAHDGAAGLTQFRTVKPDVILLDGNMPDMNGLAVLKEIRCNDAAVGIIIFSALNTKCLITEALLGGADHYLIKPSRLHEVIDAVQRVSTLVHQRRYAI